MNVGDDIARVLSTVPNAGIHTAMFVGMAGALARVRIADVDIDVPIVGATVLRPRETVQMIWVDGNGLVLGPAVARSPFGNVAAVEPPYAIVDVDGEIYTLPYRIGAAPVTGDLVEINWASGIIGGAVSARPEIPLVPPVPAQPDEYVEYVVRAIASWRFTGEWIEGDLRAGPNVTSVWIYEDLTDLLDDVTLTSVDLLMPSTGGTAEVALGTHTYRGTPFGAPTLTGLTPVTGANGWVPVPVALAAGIVAGGIGVQGDSESQWSGVLSDPSSGAIRFRGYIEGT